MERSLLLGALSLGCLGLASAAALTGGSRRTQPRRFSIHPQFVWAAALLPLVVFAGSLPSKPPFAPGMGLGAGFLIGSFGAFSAYLLSLRAASIESGPGLMFAAIPAGTMSAAVVAISVPQLLLRDNLIDGLLGVSIGWFSVGIVLLIGILCSAPDTDANDVSSRARTLLYPALNMVLGIGFVATACALSGLGFYRGGSSFEATRWCASCTAMAAGVPFTLFVCSLSAPIFARAGLKTPFTRVFHFVSQRMFRNEDSRQTAARLWRSLVGASLLSLLAWLLAVHVLNQRHLFHVALVGLVTMFGCWWLIAESTSGEPDDDRVGQPRYLGPLAVLLLVGAIIVAFNLMLGFGVGVAVLSGWLPAGFALAQAMEVSAESSGRGAARAAARFVSLVQLMLFGAVMVIYRFIATRYSDDLRGVTLTEYYGIAGLLLGATVPQLLTGLVSTATDANSRPFRPMARLALAGLFSLGFPAAALILWKAKAALAILAGLALATVGSLLGGSDQEDEPRIRVLRSLLPALFALGIVLAMGQWTHHALALSTLSRDAKAGLVKWLVGAMAIGPLLSDISDRAARRRHNRSDGTSGGPVAEGALQ